MRERAPSEEREDSGALLGAVVCPLIPAELPIALANLALWNRDLPPGEAFPGRPDIARPLLVFSFNVAENDEIRNQLVDAFDRSPNVQTGFSELIVHFCNLPANKDIYVRTPGISAYEYGNKSGPNWLFYETMRMMRGKADFVLLMEVDSQPLYSGWLRPLAETCARNADAWIIGAHYSGASPIPPRVARHINGNALYHIGSDAFWTFLEETLWPWMHAYISVDDQDLAYDCAWETFLNREEMGWNGHEDWIVARDILHRFRLTDRIVNIGGHAEQAGWYAWTREDLLRRFPDAVIVHGPVTDTFQHLRGGIAVGRFEPTGVQDHGPNWLDFAADATARRYKRSLWIPGRGLRAGDMLTVYAALDAGEEHAAIIEFHDTNGNPLGYDWLTGGPGAGEPRLEIELASRHSFVTLTIYIPSEAPAPRAIEVRDVVVMLSEKGGRPIRLHDFFW
jgi:hypothetical protein